MIEVGAGKSTPHRCEKCVEEGSYYGLLVFANQRNVPKCPHHKVALNAVPMKRAA